METSVVSVVTIYFANEMFFDEDEESIEDTRNKLVKIENFAEKIVPAMNHKQFKMHFRLSPSSFEMCLDKIRNFVTLPVHRGTPDISLEKQLLITIWYLANLECFRSVADRFGVAKSTAWKVVVNMCRSIIRVNIRLKLISWPPENKCLDIIHEFERKHQFPSVVGAIDGSHIPIKAPLQNHNSYINRKNFHSLVLQGICDNNMLFTDVYTGEAGSVHDATVFRRSDIFHRIPNICFPENSHLLGDSAYPLLKNLMVPFKNNGHLTARQRIYNKKHAKTRVVIEKAFALLKGRFRRLKLLESTRLDIAVSIIVTGCIFHNICTINQDDFNDILNLHEEIIEERRMNVVYHEAVGNNDREAFLKREHIKNNL